MKSPCDELMIQSGSPDKGCAEKAAPWVLAATILGSSLAFIDSTIVNVAAPKFQAAFHATVVDVQWVIESYGIFLPALILVGGALGDWLGRRLVFVSGVAIFAGASAGCSALALLCWFLAAWPSSVHRSTKTLAAARSARGRASPR